MLLGGLVNRIATCAENPPKWQAGSRREVAELTQMAGGWLG